MSQPEKPEKKSSVRYDNVDEKYLSERQLKKHAGWVLLWAIGVGAVISGDYGGWNQGLAVGGFGGLAIATVLMAVMYLCMVFTIAELSAALPHAGGFFSFTRNAFGPTGGYLCGLTDTIEYVLTPAVIVYYISGYLQQIPFLEEVPQYVWWLLFYAFFVVINIIGVELTFRVSLVVTVIAIGVLLFFYACVPFSESFDLAKLHNIPPRDGLIGANAWLPQGWEGVFASLPFAIWFYLAIEQLPLSAEESHDVVNDMPKALIWGILTLLVLSLLTLVLNSSVGGGALEIGKSEAPLADGFKALFGEGVGLTLMVVISLTGLIASFHAIIYAYGRVLFALSRAGYFPRWISITGERKTPFMALILGALIGLVCTGLIEYTKPPAGGTSIVGAALLNMAVFGAVISYALVMLSYIKLRVSRPNMRRPYKSPLGIPGAVVGFVLSIFALIATFAVKDYRFAIVGTAAFIVVGMLYFFLYSRNHLVAQAPEEEDALIAEAEHELA
ncbi:MAG: ethanolamine permease [Planctomycetaceae bacterium]|nr:ethanolamine permease [Planctomycetaceae bacterium]